MRCTKNKKNVCNSSLWTCLHEMVIVRSQNKITEFLTILAWASPFNHSAQLMVVYLALSRGGGRGAISDLEGAIRAFDI